MHYVEKIIVRQNNVGLFFIIKNNISMIIIEQSETLAKDFCLTANALSPCNIRRSIFLLHTIYHGVLPWWFTMKCSFKHRISPLYGYVLPTFGNVRGKWMDEWNE